MLKSHGLAQHAQDDAFREIQLNGKQLVFLFMVATVVSVVIFLCGVFVGRGVRGERGLLMADAGSASPVTSPDIVASQEPAPTPAGSDPTAAAPPPAVDELSYFNRLDTSAAAAEELTPAPERAAPIDTQAAGAKPVAPPAPATPPVARAAAAASPAPATAKPAVVAPASPAEPAGQGFALQITALRERREAESIAKRLTVKGYAAYVLTPAKGAPSIYRVRIGKFKTRREAEAIATRLQKEEQFTPWITR
jgi:cell division septation protein DedD